MTNQELNFSFSSFADAIRQGQSGSNRILAIARISGRELSVSEPEALHESVCAGTLERGAPERADQHRMQGV